MGERASSNPLPSLPEKPGGHTVSGQPSRLLPATSDYKLSLAEDILLDIELSRQPLDKSLLKTYTLARLMGNETMLGCLQKELDGYKQGGYTRDEESASMRKMDRMPREGWGTIEYLEPLSQVLMMLSTEQERLRGIRTPDISISGEHRYHLSGNPVTDALKEVTMERETATNRIHSLSGITVRVTSLIHDYVTTVYHSLRFGAIQETFFETHRGLVDSHLSAGCADVLGKVPAIYQRLADGDEESISQALNTCRRMVDSFADKVFPAQPGTVEVGGKSLEIGIAHVKNRVNAFVSEHCSSRSRCKRLRDTLSNLYDRICAGVHKDVTPEEARFLFIETYLFLGEVLSLGAPRVHTQTVVGK